MNAIKLVYEIYTYFVLLSSVEEQELGYLRTAHESTTFQKEVSLSYDMITLRLDRVTSKNDKSENSLYLQCKFYIRNGDITIYEIYCANKEREGVVKNYIQQNMPERFPASGNTSVYDAEIQRYVSIADTIAKQSYSYSSGDDYRPGNFTEVIIDDEMITLTQINRHNSRSIDHKDNYTLRDLEFFIPLTPAVPTPAFQDEHIGRMVIRFSDHSSKKNKQGGDQIREKIDGEKLKFENEAN